MAVRKEGAALPLGPLGGTKYMKKRILSILCAAVMLLTACSQPAQSGSGSASGSEEETITILATTYPVYLFANTVVQGVEGVVVDRLDTGAISCLHDYTLSVGDMKKIEGADVIAINGVGLETFMEDALASSQATVIDTSEGVELLESLAHHHEEGDAHDHGHYDPHIWMSPKNAITMIQNISESLAKLTPKNAPAYLKNTTAAMHQLETCDKELEELVGYSRLDMSGGLVTFHDGFQYFAKAFHIPLLAAIEEEAGSEASAKEINEITAMVKDQSIPMIYAETNGSDATAQAISRETGCAVGQLNMLMSGEGQDVTAYIESLKADVQAVVDGLTGNVG